jgi:hypothetical protein
LYFRDPSKFFDHAKKYIEYLKKQIESSSPNEQNNPYRIQIAELCKDIIEEKRLQLNQEDEKVYRLLTLDMLLPMKIISANLNEFVCLKTIVLFFVFFHLILLVK